MNNLTTKFEEVQLVYYNKMKDANRPKIKDSSTAYSLFRSHWDDAQINLLEECKILLLDNSLNALSISSISKGGMQSTVVDVRLIFATALQRRAHSLIMAHNHPSGNLSPSSADLKLTENIAKAGKIMNIPLLDHLIITSDGFYSLSDQGYMGFNL